jgi:hypothetical protein
MPSDAAVRDDARAFATPRDARDARDGARRDAPAPRARPAREREPWRARVAMRRVGRPLVIAIARATGPVRAIADGATTRSNPRSSMLSISMFAHPRIRGIAVVFFRSDIHSAIHDGAHHSG